MKKIAALCILLLFRVSGFTQIVIDQSDMPVAGDTLRVSIATAIPGDFTKTGNDTTWDFSELSAMNQLVDTFVTKQSTPVLFQLAFPAANLASPGGVPALPGIAIQNPYTFFENSESFFGNLGFAFSVTLNGFPLPATAPYNNPDKYYTFPLNINSNWNSTSSVNLSFPGLASFYTSRSRESQVDGWGTLITPFGTFSTLRVKSHLIEYDSLFLSTPGIGLPVLRDITEYKWLANGKGIPLLQINQEGPVTTAIYRDIFRQEFRPVIVDLGADTAVYQGTVLTINAQVTGGTPPYTYIWSDFEMTPSVTVTIDSNAVYSVLVMDAANNAGIGSRSITVKGPGIEEKNILPLAVYPNPANGSCEIRLPYLSSPSSLQIVSSQGQLVREIQVTKQHPGLKHLDLTDIPAGFYFFKLSDGSKTFVGKLVIGH
ncbi:MAG: T9SS type A sorting domain-containing protein [Bacteroidetes bacterium]|nr:T9SS type A sorting domain-containing protein [Bacteroidota bacterium]